MLVLLKIMPFLIDSVADSEYIKLLFELLRIVKILFSPIIALTTLQKMKLLIEEHLKHFKQLFPDVNIIPKQHYLLHLPSQIRQLGPAVRHMCMRFESKHCFFKQWSLKSNFKNICKSLVKHNQQYECSLNARDKHPIFDVEMGPPSEVGNINYVKEKMAVFFGMDVQYAMSVRWLLLHGNKYACERTLIVSDIIGNSPEFALIKNIYIVNSSVYCFECQPFVTIQWSDTYLSYEVEVPNQAQANVFVDAGNLIDYTPYYYFTFKNNKYIPVKYDLSDTLAHYTLNQNI